MKKIILLLLFSMIFLQSVSALDVQIKSSYDRGETLIAKITGVTDSVVSPDNIYFYNGRVRTPVFYDVAKIQDVFYVYAILPETSGNYTLKIKDVTYRDGTKTITSDIEKNFTISENLADFNVNPGYIITNDEFSIKLQNLQSVGMNININTIFSSEQTILLKFNEEKSISFGIPEGLNASIYNVTISTLSNSYSIPVLLTKSTTIPDRRNFRFTPSILNISLVQGENKTFIAYLYNTGQTNITDISLSTENFEDLILLDSENISNLVFGENQKIKLFIYPTQVGTFRGNIIAESNGLRTFFPLTLNVYSQQSQISINQSQQNAQDYYIEDRTCRNINGVFCSQNQKCICNASVIKGGRCEEQFIEGSCCLGSCEDNSKTAPAKSSTLGWFIVLVLLVVVFWFLKKNFGKN